MTETLTTVDLHRFEKTGQQVMVHWAPILE